MPNQGKRVIIVIVTVALLAATLAWWHNYRQGQRILQLWGSPAAQRIRLAPDCELQTLAPSEPSETSSLLIDGQPYTIHQRCAVGQAPGFVHARQALIADGSYRWQSPPAPPEDAHWSYGLRFQDPQGATWLVFDLTHGRILDVDQHRQADISPIAAGLRSYFEEQLPRSAELEP